MTVSVGTVEDLANCPITGPEQSITIRVLQTDGKEILLRGAKVDRVIKWINLLALV